MSRVSKCQKCLVIKPWHKWCDHVSKIIFFSPSFRRLQYSRIVTDHPFLQANFSLVHVHSSWHHFPCCCCRFLKSCSRTLVSLTNQAVFQCKVQDWGVAGLCAKGLPGIPDWCSGISRSEADWRNHVVLGLKWSWLDTRYTSKPLCYLCSPDIILIGHYVLLY